MGIRKEDESDSEELWLLGLVAKEVLGEQRRRLCRRFRLRNSNDSGQTANINAPNIEIKPNERARWFWKKLTQNELQLQPYR